MSNSDKVNGFNINICTDYQLLRLPSASRMLSICTSGITVVTRTPKLVDQEFTFSHLL